jgi:hypothetical protein
MCPYFACTVAIASRDAIRSSAVSPIPTRIGIPLRPVMLRPISHLGPVRAPRSHLRPTRAPPHFPLGAVRTEQQPRRERNPKRSCELELRTEASVGGSPK